MVRIAIIDLATMPAPHLDKFESVSTLVIDWLGPHLPEAELVPFDVKAGVPLPRPEAFDGIILPGSEMGVYDQPPWMEALRAFLLDVRAARTPIYGICFGHQMMAHTYGGQAEKADAGFCLGVRTFTDKSGGQIVGHVAHQDQVTQAPPDARITASAAYCPVGALDYDFPAMSTQFHPEYSPGVIAGIADVLDGQLMTSEEAEAARAASVESRVRQDLFAAEVAAFFRRYI